MDKRPDFQTITIDIPVIREIKNSNDPETFEYTSIAAQPAAGIATDGFTWILYTKNRDDERPVYEDYVIHESI